MCKLGVTGLGRGEDSETRLLWSTGREADDGRDLASYSGRIHFTNVWSNMSLLLLIHAVARAIQIPILGSLFHAHHLFLLQRQGGAKCSLNKSVQPHLELTCLLCVHCSDGKNSVKGSLLKSCIKISCIAGNGRKEDKRKHMCALSYPAVATSAPLARWSPHTVSKPALTWDQVSTHVL